jgi:hypothetical protein
MQKKSSVVLPIADELTIDWGLYSKYFFTFAKVYCK